MKKIIFIPFLLFSYSVFSQHTESDLSKLSTQNKETNQGPEQDSPATLTHIQKQRLKEFRLVFMKETLPIKNELNEKEARLKTLRTNQNPEIKQINSLLDEIGLLKTTIAKKKEAMLLEFRKSLSDEQKVYFDTDRKAFMKQVKHKEHSSGKRHPNKRQHK